MMKTGGVVSNGEVLNRTYNLLDARDWAAVLHLLKSVLDGVAGPGQEGESVPPEATDKLVRPEGFEPPTLRSEV